MSIRTKATLLTLIIAIPAFLSARAIWPDAADIPQPTSGQLLWFIVLSVFESFALGLAVSLVAFGWPLLKRNVSASDRMRATITFIAIVWALGSWWSHDNMHRHNGHDMSGLLLIEYLYHATLMLGAAIVAWNFLYAIKRLSPQADKTL